MAFDKVITATPVEIADISVTLTDYIATDEPARKAGEYSVQVRYSNGSLMVLTGDLVPHLTPAQITSLMAFMDVMRTKAKQEILP